MASIPLPALSVKPPEQPDVLGQYGNLLRLKGLQQSQQLQQQQGQIQAQQLQQQQIQTQEAQQAQKDQQNFRALIADPANQGKTIGEIADVAAKNNAISPQAWQQAKKLDVEQRTSLADLTEKDLANRKAAHDATQSLYNNVMNMPDEQLAANWPAIAQQYDAIPGNNKQPLDPNKPLSKQDLAHFGPMFDMGNAYFDQEMARREKKAQTASAEVDAQTKVRANTASQLAAATDQASYDRLRGELPHSLAVQFPDKFDKDAVLQAGMSPHEQATVPIANQEAKAWLHANPGKTLADYQRYEKTLVPAFNFNLTNTGTGGTPGAGGATDWNSTAKRFGFTPQAFDAAAEKYFQTGSLPPSGRGGPALAANKAIMNRAADLHPGESLAESSAAYKANSESLKKLQTQRDAVVAFENTAGKNLDLFLTQAQKVVDSGSPWINRPLRSVLQQGLGSADLAAYNTARQVAINEIAKVTSNPGMSGQLSDSARHEVEAFNPASATLKQTLEVAKVLKQDMENRRTSYDQQISDIQSRFGGKKTASPQTTPANTGGIKINRDANGRIIGIE